jgi:LmbE family N-acetylglucosaminyl deacetylase
MKNRILILSPHTDDAELGCGGSICRFLAEQNEIYWVVFSTAEDSLPDNLPKDTLVKEFQSVADYLNLNSSQYMVNNFQVRKLSEKRQEVLELLVKIRNDFSPHLVVGPSLNDYHQDHIVVANEMIRAFKMNSSIICYELPWNQVTFNSQLFIKLDQQHMDMKIRMLQKYHSQMALNRNYFSENFIRGLAYTRGAQIGSVFAEAFEVIRWIQ